MAGGNQETERGLTEGRHSNCPDYREKGVYVKLAVDDIHVEQRRSLPQAYWETENPIISKVLHTLRQPTISIPGNPPSLR